MKKQILMVVGFAVLTMFFCCGCSLFSPAIQTGSYYELQYSKKEKMQLPFHLTYYNFRNISPAGLNLLYSKKDNQVTKDQYNFWTQSPENMLHRFMLNAVSSNFADNDRTAELSLTIFDFKFDVEGKKCVLGVQCKLRSLNSGGKKWEKVYIIETPVESVRRTAFVSSMNKCAEKFVTQFISDIKNF